MDGGGWLWEKLAAEAPFLSEKGFTALWIPPFYKASVKESAGYNTYDLWDLGEFDQKGEVRTKYGTKDQLTRCIETLHTYGISVYGDVVFNHKAGADDKEWAKGIRVEFDDRRVTRGHLTDVQVWTKFNFPGRHGAYSNFQWDHRHFTGVDYESSRKERSIFLFEGKQWAHDVDEERGNFDYLMHSDIDVNHPEVKQELINWGVWVVNTLGLDGFRLDAVKHVSFSFFRDWMIQVRQETGKNLYAVGEYWSGDLGRLENYLDKTQGMIELFDVPLHHRFHHASVEKERFDLRKLREGTLSSRFPELAVTFVDNHDTQPGSDFTSWVAEWFKPLAYAYILLRNQGYPCVFYGDYFGIPRSHYPGLKPELDILMNIRKAKAYGPQHDQFSHHHLIGWSREGAPEVPFSGCAVVLSNRGSGTVRLFMGVDKAGKSMKAAFGHGIEWVKINDQGWGDFQIRGTGLEVWINSPES